MSVIVTECCLLFYFLLETQPIFQNIIIILIMLTKKPRIQPLSVSDVLSIMIMQQKKKDRTQQYKQILRKYSAIYEQNGHKHIQQLQLPEFATQEMNQSQLFDYHIENKNLKQVSKYEALLQKVNKKIKQRLQISHSKVCEGQENIDSLIEHLGNAFAIIDDKRKHIKYLKDEIQRKYRRIGPSIRKINNLTKVLQITKIWGTTKLPYLLSININQPQRINIKDVISLLDSAIQIINENSQNSKALISVVKTLENKKETLVKKVYENFYFSVIQFSSISDYKVKFQQYELLKGSSVHCPDILNNAEIQLLIRENGLHLSSRPLKELGVVNVDSLNEMAYINYFSQVVEEYVVYFKNWHFVTKFHMDNQTKYERLFLENRRQIYKTLSQIISSTIENSKKFISLQYKLKLQLIQKLQQYLVAGEKWNGKCQSIKLQKVVTQKLKKQLQNIFKLYNNLIKNILTQDLTFNSVQVNSSHPFEKRNQNYNIRYNDIYNFINNITSSEAKIQQQHGFQVPQYPKTSSKTGGIFIEMISQYIERSQYLQTNKSVYIDSIIQHYEFIMLMMFQLCLKDTVKQRRFYNIREKVAQLENIRLQESHLLNLNVLVRDQLYRKKYENFYQLLHSIGNKFDGAQIADIIDVNKLYDNGSDELVMNYTHLIIRVIADLLKIINWLLPISHKIGQHNKKSYLQHMPILIKELFSVLLENNGEWLKRKYVTTLTPIVTKLKWEVKKFNQQTAIAYKQYKMKSLQIFRNSTLIMRVNDEGGQEMKEIMEEKQLQVFYKSLMEVYSKIEKINDNGRQLIILDSDEIFKILKDIGVQAQAWHHWFYKYLSLAQSKKYKLLMEDISKLGLLYPPVCWKSSIMYVISDFSTKQRKEYGAFLARFYATALRDSQM